MVIPDIKYEIVKKVGVGERAPTRFATCTAARPSGTQCGASVGDFVRPRGRRSH